MARASAKLRLLQFVEALNAVASAHDALHAGTKRRLEAKVPGFGRYLRSVAEGITEGVCNALEKDTK